jgi:hypothetical protein
MLKSSKTYKQNLITQYYNLKSIVIDSNNDSFELIIDSKYEEDSNNETFYGYNIKTDNWHCLECGDNMGNNPRQLCGKSYCLNT